MASFFSCPCMKWLLRSDAKQSSSSSSYAFENDSERGNIVVIKPGDAASGDHDDDDDRYDAVLEDIPVLTSTTPLLPKGPPLPTPLPRTGSKQRLVSYQHSVSAAPSAAAGAECLVCLDGFSPDNPCMPTLCACGEGKAMFHYGTKGPFVPCAASPAT